MNYTETELARLHTVLYEILGEIVRVCKVLDIPYFIQGGSGIGAFFEQAILPWDDDIDVGMSRENYERFLREAPSVLGPDYFLQHPGSEPHTPFYFAKLRRNGTTFAEHQFFSLPINHGIFVDIFPFDRVPDRQWLQQLHRSWCNALNACFMAKDIWQWKHIKKCQVDEPRERGWLACFITWIVTLILPKSAIYRLLAWSQGLFNGSRLFRSTYYNMVLMPRDHIAVESIEHLDLVPFGPLQVYAPSNLETYLRHHYPRLRRHIPKEEQINHRPEYLEF